MKANRILFIIIILLRHSFAMDDSAVSIVQKYSSCQLLSVEQARDFIQDLWSQSFCCIKAESPIQKLTSGFQSLLNHMEDNHKLSLVEQAYLQWCSGRTHGFGSEGSNADILAIQTTRRLITRNIAKGMMEHDEDCFESLTSTEETIQNMLQEESVDESVRKQDNELVASIRTELLNLWLRPISEIEFTLNVNNTLEDRSIRGIWKTCCCDMAHFLLKKPDLITVLVRSHQNHGHLIKEAQDLEAIIAEKKHTLATQTNALKEQQKEKQLMDAALLKQQEALLLLQKRLEEERQHVNSEIGNLSPQLEELRRELQKLANDRDRSLSEQNQLDEESARKRRALQTVKEKAQNEQAHISPERTDVSRSLFPNHTRSRIGFSSWISPQKLLLASGFSVMPVFDLPTNWFSAAQKYPALWALLQASHSN